MRANLEEIHPAIHEDSPVDKWVAQSKPCCSKCGATLVYRDYGFGKDWDHPLNKGCTVRERP